MSSVPPPPPPVPPPPPPNLSSYPPPAGSSVMNKVMTFAAIGMGVGFGTCSIAAVASGGNRFGQSFIAIGAGLFFASLATLVVCGVIAVVNALFRSSRR